MEATYSPFRTWGDVCQALRSNDEERIAIAGEACVFMGTVASKFLVTELANTKNRPAYRVRVAGVLERIGALYRPHDICNLVVVVFRDKHAAVRDATARVIAAIRAGEPGAMSPEQAIESFREDREFRLGIRPPAPEEQDVSGASSSATLVEGPQRSGRRRRKADRPTALGDAQE